MTREELKKAMPILTAFVEGKTIQCYDPNTWKCKDEVEQLPTDDLFVLLTDFRIKPEPKYRPFKDGAECWREMQKHQPFGWIKSKDDSTINKFMFIDSLENNAANICTSSDFSYNKLTECYIFADGTPFGMKEE